MQFWGARTNFTIVSRSRREDLESEPFQQYIDTKKLQFDNNWIKSCVESGWELFDRFVKYDDESCCVNVAQFGMKWYTFVCGFMQHENALVVAGGNFMFSKFFNDTW